jgi:hypothetical protein
LNAWMSLTPTRERSDVRSQQQAGFRSGEFANG